MKTIKELLEPYYRQTHNGFYECIEGEYEEILRTIVGYVEEVIDRCADAAEMKLVNGGWDDYHEIDRESILKIKEELQ